MIPHILIDEYSVRKWVDYENGMRTGIEKFHDPSKRRPRQTLMYTLFEFFGVMHKMIEEKEKQDELV